MNFFKDLKEDLSQAVNELIPEDDLLGDEEYVDNLDDELLGLNDIKEDSNDKDKEENLLSDTDEIDFDAILKSADEPIVSTLGDELSSTLEASAAFNLEDENKEIELSADEPEVEEHEIEDPGEVDDDLSDLIKEFESQIMTDEAENEFQTLPDDDLNLENLMNSEEELTLEEPVYPLEEGNLLVNDSDLEEDMLNLDDNLEQAMSFEEENVETDLIEQMLHDSDENETEEPFVMPDELADSMEEEDKPELLAQEEEGELIPTDAATEVTVITKGTRIASNIISDGSLEIMGTVKGDIECLGKLSITGHVAGNLKASEIFVNTTKLQGNLVSRGTVKLGAGTVVLGDIKATSAVIAGAVKGEIDVNGPIVVDSTGIIKGNIKAKSVQVNNGAIIDGYCSLTYANVNIDNFFDGENEEK